MINEIISSNATGIEDEDGDRPDWIELYNRSPVATSTAGYGLSDDPKQPYKWRLPSRVVPGRGFLLVYASGKDRTNDLQRLHANFSIRADGERLFLTGPLDGVMQDFPSTPLPRDISAGRMPDGGSNVVYLGRSTPGVANVVPGYSAVCAPPTFSREGGPATDRRNGIRPARGDGSAQFQHIYLNFAITDEKLGPTSQPGVKLAICMTYYDDPNLVGAQFRPEVYISDKGGVEGFAFTGGDIAVRLEGTDTWRDAYFEINDVKFSGVNQGPQAAARFYVSDKVIFSKVRYGVIRPCDPNGVNPLASCKPVIPPVNPEISFTRNADGSLKIMWASSAADFALEQSLSLTAPNWVGVAEVPVVAGDQVSVTVKPVGSTYYRLRK